MTVEMNATQTPINMDFCMPRRVWAKMSCPSALVPNQWASNSKRLNVRARAVT